MKYCPFCGAELLPAPFLFARSVGKPCLRPMLVYRGRLLHQKERRKRNRKSQAPSAIDSNYDGYYDDVEPLDADREREGMDTRLIGKVALVCLGVALVIGGCVAGAFLL